MKKKKTIKSMSIKQLLKWDRELKEHICFPVGGLSLLPQITYKWLQSFIMVNCCKECQKTLFKESK